jgi:N-acetylglucosamine-6-phosphate deacetylase
LRQVIVNGRVFDGESVLENQAVLIDGDRVVALAETPDLIDQAAEIYDLRGGILLPGFVDLQVNGGGGVLFNGAPTVGTLRTVASAHRQYGTTGLLPTLISDSFDVMRRAIDAVRQAIEEGVPGVLGIHLEGPFLNPERSGAHDPEKFCGLDEEGIELISSLEVGKTLVTLAPELTTPATISAVLPTSITQ